MAESIQLERRGDFAMLRFNRPEKLNAFDAETRRALVRAVDALAADVSVKGLVLTGAGRAFSAGQDLAESVNFTAADAGPQNALALTFFRALRGFEKPLVAALNGLALGLGFQIALLCDFRIAHAGVLMGQPEVKAGLPSVIGSCIMSWYLGQAANADLSLSGRMLEAEEGRSLGLITRIVPEAEVLPVALALAAEMAARPPLAYRLTKRNFALRSDAELAAALARAADYQAQAYASGEAGSVMRAFLGKRGGG
jgi:enoyl-CoA hydratase/carnithine racemase